MKLDTNKTLPTMYMLPLRKLAVGPVVHCPLLHHSLFEFKIIARSGPHFCHCDNCHDE